MGILHTVNKSPFTHSALKSCIAVCANEDALLLIEDGVFGGISNSPDAIALLDLINRGINIYALSEDVGARGIEKKIYSQIQMINYDGFVKLALDHKCVQSWY